MQCHTASTAKTFKVGLSPSKKIRVICFIESPLKIMKIIFISSSKLFSFSRYFHSQDIFILKIFSFSRYFHSQDINAFVMTFWT